MGLSRPTVAFAVHEMRVGGAELMVRHLIEGLADRVSPVLVCLDAIGPLGEEMAAEGVHVVEGKRRPGLDLRCGLRIGRACHELGVDLVHAQQYSPFFYSALGRAMTRADYRIVLTEHGRPAADQVSRRRRVVNRHLLARQADAVTACSNFSRQALIEVEGLDHRPISIVANGVDIGPDSAGQDPATARARCGLDPVRRHVLCAARLDPVKDHATLLEAFALVARRVDDVDLVIAGDGPLADELPARAIQLGIADRVLWLGVRDDVNDLMSASEIVVLNSETEAAPLVVLEASAAARPVVVTDVGGIGELVDDRVEGLVVPAGSPRATADALTELLNDADLARRLGRAGRQRAVREFRREDMVEAYWAVYRSVLDPGVSRRHHRPHPEEAS